MGETDAPLDISVGIVSQDPYFIIACRALLGRDPCTRILHIGPSIADFERSLDEKKVKALVCDLDTVESIPAFYRDLRHNTRYPLSRSLYLAAGSLKEAASAEVKESMRFWKDDLGFCPF
jgi:hypothetical protein